MGRRLYSYPDENPETPNARPFTASIRWAVKWRVSRHLARILGPEQRFYGIQAPPEMHNAEFAVSIESMARYYLEALVAFQPEGPYLLGGWSAGSVIALEMAQLLKVSGRKVELLIALDGARSTPRPARACGTPCITGSWYAISRTG